MQIALTSIVAAWAITLCWFDLRERRLPNTLTLGGAATMLVFRLGYGGAPAFLDGFVGAVVAGAFLMLPFLMRGAGGGDVKMLFASGSITGWYGLFPLLWVMALTGIVFGLALMVAGRVDAARVKHYSLCALNWNYDRVAGAAALPPKDSERARMPFSIPIAAGLIASLLV
jgi:Flp pilus assembly protein protease CpaA